MLRNGLIVIIATTIIACATVNAVVPCGYVSPSGAVYSFNNLTWPSTGIPFFADDGQHHYFVNLCATVNEASCRAIDGFACMYNATKPDSDHLEAVLATLRDKPQSAYWEEQFNGGQVSGLKLSAYNGFYGSVPVKFTLEIACDSTVIVPDKQLQVNAIYDTATFKFQLKSSAACSYTRAAFAVEPTLLLRHGLSPVYVTVTSLPPVDVTLRCDSPFLFANGFEISFKGPENGKPATYQANVKLVEDFDANRDSFALICTTRGSNATLYQYPRTVNVFVVPYESKGHTSISGGSVFIIILVVVGFCYILFGCLYRWRVVGSEPGIESFPNIEMWRSLWQYVKDGASFTAGGCKKRGAYNEVNDTH